MTLAIASRDDITLDAYRRVAWRGEGVRFTDASLARMAAMRQSFLALLDDSPDQFIYGVTSGYGQNASIRLTLEQRRAHAATPPYGSAMSYGEPLPERLVRGIVLARLANFAEGHAAVTPALAQAVAALLDGPLPPLGSRGNQSAGEIMPLASLLLATGAEHLLGEKEALALINGSPCASALVADTALAAGGRLGLALDVLALAAEALRSPHEHYDAALDELWGDRHEAAALAALRGRMAGGTGTRRAYQAPVSFRIAPRVLGQAQRALAQATEVAQSSLRAVTDNPVYLPPDRLHPHGRVLSTGGYHNARACPAMDALTASYADLALLCDRQASKLLDGRVSMLPDQLRAGDGYLGCLGFVAADCAERARTAAVSTLLPGSEGGGFGQNDVSEPVFTAWDRNLRAGGHLEGALAALAAVASQALHVTGRDAPPALRVLLAMVREHLQVVEAPRALGPEINALAARFSERTLRDGGVNELLPA